MLRRRAALILLVAGCAGCSAQSARRPLEDADAALRSVVNAEIVEGQRLLNAREPALAERVRLAQLNFARAEAVLVLPRDARRLADLHVWLGIAQMQLAHASKTPAPAFERARDHFRIARELFESVQALSEAEAVGHLLRRAADEAALAQP